MLPPEAPAADMMSGGDLDGVTFFVCWDSELVPERLSEPALYPGAREAVTFKAITDQDRLEYFARYNNASLGSVKNRFLDWARLKGPMSPECQQLNRLFSQCVDGNYIKVPDQLKSPPPPPLEASQFILDTLHDAAKVLISTRQQSSPNYDGYNLDAMELFLSRDDVAMSEFELIKLSYRWCRKNNATLADFLHLFDPNLLSAEEKLWVLNQLPPSAELSSIVMNALCRSNLIEEFELRPYKLNYPGLRWKCIFDSSQDRLAIFLDEVMKALELFHRKLIVIRVDERLTLAIYVPQKIERRQEQQVDDRVRVFAFPHSRGNKTTHRLALPTKKNYRLYCDSSRFDLFERARSNSWIVILRGASDDSGYRNEVSTSKYRKGRQATIDDGVNFDCRASVALDKFGGGLQTQIGRVNRNGVLGAEIYVISNRDVKSMQNLDLWLDFVDTNEIMPLFERNAKEYHIPILSNMDWSLEPERIVQIAKYMNFSAFDDIESVNEYSEIFSWLLGRGERGLLTQCFTHLLKQLENANSETARTSTILNTMIDFLRPAPFLSIMFARMDDCNSLPLDLSELLKGAGPQIMQALILCANEMRDFVVEPFKTTMSRITSISLTEFASLVELISLTVRSPDLALDLLLECLEPQSSRVLTKDPILVAHFVRNLLGIALDHIDEAEQPQPPREDLLDLKLAGFSKGYPLLKAQIRIDAPVGTLATSDHVRLTAASSPVNSVTTKVYSMDVLVESFEVGSATFRCFHPPPPFVEECSWELQNCGSFVTSKTMFDAIHTLATQPYECCNISDEILGRQAGQSTSSPERPAKYAAKKSLNPSQTAAVEAALAFSVVCLWGPPGTGKTHTIVEIITELQASPSRRILVTAPTHNAVDNVMRKYLEEATKIGKSNSAESKPLRVSTEVRKVAEDLKKYTCDAMVGKEIHTNHSTKNKARDQVKKSRLIFTTCIGAGIGLIRSETFDTVIIDETSQQTEPASLVPLVQGCKKAILVGDHVQLGATVQKHAVLQQFDISLFERLYKQQSPSNTFTKVMLDTQYRMHPSICQFSSDEFYESKLRTGIANTDRVLPPSQFPWPSTATPAEKEPRIVFIECSTPEDLKDLRGRSKSNEGQAKLCHEICKLLCSPPPATIPPSPKPAPSKPTEQPFIAVLTPYTRQVNLLKRQLAFFSNIEVSSIDGFQGREADIVIFVTVRCNVHYDIGFLKDLRRLNVVLTRAKYGVVVIGNRGTLTLGTKDEESRRVWQRLIKGLVGVDIKGEDGKSGS